MEEKIAKLRDLLLSQARAGRLRSLLDSIYGAAQTGAEAYGSASQPLNAQQAGMLGGMIADFTPVVGDVKAGYDMIDSARQGNYGEAALNGLGLLPFVPAMGGMVKGAKYSAKEALEKAKQLSPDVKRVVNPETWDDSLGGAAWFDRRTPGVYHAIHVTDNPSKAGKAIKKGKDITQEYRDGRNLGELGSGLYVSARPDMWGTRAAEGMRKDIPVSVKGDFVELDRPWNPALEDIRALGFDGAYMRGAMGSVPQMVIWNNDAIKSFGKFSK